MTLCSIKNESQYWNNTDLKPVQNGLVLWVTSDFGINTSWADLSGVGNNGNVVGVLNRVQSDTSDIFGSGYSFNDTTDYIDFGTSETLNFIGLPTMSISMWVYYRDTNDAVFFQKGQTGGGINPKVGWSFRTIGGKLAFEKHAYSNTSLSVVTVPSNILSNVGVVVNGSSVTFYRDGVKYDTITNSSSIYSASGYTSRMGRSNWGNTTTLISGLTNANIYDCKIYNITLSEAEMLYNHTHSPYYYIKDSIL